jgi:hypothetical protein
MKERTVQYHNSLRKHRAETPSRAPSSPGTSIVYPAFGPALSFPHPLSTAHRSLRRAGGALGDGPARREARLGARRDVRAPAFGRVVRLEALLKGSNLGHQGV